MLYGFSVAPSINTNEPLASYFDGLRMLAAQAVTSFCTTDVQAWSLCEFLDAVDSRAMHSTRSEYSQCLEALIGFLSAEDNLAARLNLANKSWAAKTCHDLLEVTGEAVLQPPRLHVA